MGSVKASIIKSLKLDWFIPQTYFLSSYYMSGTVLRARHTTVNITKIPALNDSILLSNEILHPLEKSKSKGYKVVS